MATNLSFNVAAFDRASDAFIKVGERLDRLVEKLDRLDGKRINIPVDADTARADEKLDNTRRKADELDKSRINIKIDDGGKTQLIIAAVVAGLSAIGYLGPAAAAGVAAVPAAVGVLAQGVATLGISLSGVGDGVKALDAAEAGLAQGGAQAEAAQRKLEDVMAGMSPSAQNLAESIHGKMVPALHEIRDDVQDATLPKLQVSMENLIKLSPDLSAGLSHTGQVLGDLAIKGSAMVTSGPWRADFATIMASNDRSLQAFGTAGLSATDAVRSLTVSALPLIERFAQATERGAALADQFIQTKRTSGELDTFMHQAGDTLATFGHVAIEVVTGVTQLTLSLGPLGGILLKTVGWLTQLIGELASAHPLLAQFAAAGYLVYTVVTRLIPVGATLIATYGKVKGVIDTATAALTVGRTAADGFAEGLSGAGATSERAAGSGGRFSNVMSKIGSALPVVGAALIGVALSYDNARSSADAATDAISRGGAEAIKAVRDLQAADANAQAHSFGNWIQSLSRWLGLAQPSLQETKDKLDAVGKAHLDAAQASIRYQDALKRFPPDSAEVRSASAALTAAVDSEQRAQQQAADSTREHTQALVEQQNTMLAQTDKDLAFRQSLLSVEQAQKTLSDAVKQHGAASLEARDAGLQYESSLLREIQALGDNVRAQNSAKTASEQDRLAISAQKDEIFRMAAAAGGAAPPALLRMAGGLSNADFTARGATVSVNNLGQRVISLPNGKKITITADTAQAQGAIDGFINRNNGRTITLGVRTTQPDGSFTVHTMKAQALGGIVAPMASGGIRPMSAGYAQVVPPNTPRLIGDRPQDNESFIPWDGSARSRQILAQTAAAMGYQLVPRGAGQRPPVVINNTNYLADPVDVDLLADRLAFKASAAAL